LRTAIVHDWLYTYAGSERVVEQMINVLPDADLFALFDFLPAGERGFIHDKPVVTSFIQRMPFARTRHRQYLPLMPLAIESLDVTEYDLVVSSNHAVAKGVLTGPHQLHICMCYSPIRYAWDLQHQYLRESKLDRGLKSILARLLLHYIRIWDFRTANLVDHFIAISNFVARRIKKYYCREATVIYPPVDVEKYTLNENREDYYLTASRMVPYKKIDLVVEAFGEMPERELIVIGEGPDLRKVEKLAVPNVRVLGYQSDEVLRDYMQRARAFVFAGLEDFGIIPIEAQACGTPVIAYGRGGLAETIKGLDNGIPTGVFFYEQTRQSLIEACMKFEDNQDRFSSQACRENAMRFSIPRFQNEFKALVDLQWAEFKSRQ
jgi:glycosyltransferase involved in cell wall biosynthesis